MGDGEYAYNRFRCYSSYSPEFYNNYHNSDYINTHSSGQPSSQTNRGGNTCFQGYLGHLSHQSPNPNGSSCGWMVGWPGLTYKAKAFRDVGTLPNEDHQDYAIYGEHNSSTGTYFHVNSRSALRYYHECIQRDQGEINIPTKASGGRGMYGAISYNKKTKKLAVLENTGNAWEHHPHVWNSVPNLRAYGNAGMDLYSDKDDQYGQYGVNDTTLQTYFNDASNANTSYPRWNNSDGNWGTRSESEWRSVIVLCDNGVINCHTMDARNDGGYAFRRWGGDTQTNSGQSGTLAAYGKELISHNNWGVQVYGYDQGNQHGVRWQQSSDGRYVWSYQQAYYYGAGFAILVTRVADGKCLWQYYQDSTNGWHFLPIGKSNMMIGYTENADDPGYRYRIMNLDNVFEMYHDKQQIDFVGSNCNYMLNVCGNSTQYPYVVPAMYDTSLFSNPHQAEIKRS